MASFTVASSRLYVTQNGEQKEQTAWINVVAWGAIAERVSNFCKKGTFVYIHGSLNTRSYDDDSGQRHWIMEVVADIVADPKWGEGRSGQGSAGYNQPPSGYGQFSGGLGVNAKDSAVNSGGFNQFCQSRPEQPTVEQGNALFPAGNKDAGEEIPF